MLMTQSSFRTGRNNLSYDLIHRKHTEAFTLSRRDWGEHLQQSEACLVPEKSRPELKEKERSKRRVVLSIMTVIHIEMSR